MIHEPVLLEKVLAFMDFQKGETVLDGTLGAGGYSSAILERIGEEGRLIALDRDGQAIQAAKEKLAGHSNLVLCHVNYSSFDEALAGERIARCHKMVLDLGLSKDQFLDAKRGFSFSKIGPLDMRIGPEEETLRANDLLNSLGEIELADLIWRLGEERYSRQIARAIVDRRKTRPFETTEDLAKLIESMAPRKFHRIHPATRTFQALRIAVNRELEHLEIFLEKFPKFLEPGGRLGIVTFHSLEDRIVKLRFRSLAQEGGFRLVNKKVEVPEREEVEGNPSARSAKLRVIEKIK